MAAKKSGKKAVTAKRRRNRSGRMVSLSQAVENLRRELDRARRYAEGELVRFDVEKVEVELHVDVERERGAEGGVKFWVVQGKAGGKTTRRGSQTVRLTLRPVVQREGSGDGGSSRPVVENLLISNPPPASGVPSESSSS